MHVYVYIPKDPELQRRAGPVQRGATAGRRQPPGGLLQQSGRGGQQTLYVVTILHTASININLTWVCLTFERNTTTHTVSAKV